jgi:hypothetical protein
MGLPRHARNTLRTTKDERRPDAAASVPQQLPGKSPVGRRESPPEAKDPDAHDAQCVYARMLVQLRWQLAEARQENSELTVSLRKLLHQIQSLNILLDSYSIQNAGGAGEP